MLTKIDKVSLVFLHVLYHLLCNLVVIAVTAPFTSEISNSLSMSVGGLLKGRECVSSCFCIQKKACHILLTW